MKIEGTPITPNQGVNQDLTEANKVHLMHDSVMLERHEALAVIEEQIKDIRDKLEADFSLGNKERVLSDMAGMEFFLKTSVRLGDHEFTEKIVQEMNRFKDRYELKFSEPYERQLSFTEKGLDEYMETYGQNMERDHQNTQMSWAANAERIREFFSKKKETENEEAPFESLMA